MVDEITLKNSFKKIKKDMNKQDQEINYLKESNKELLQEIKLLKEIIKNTPQPRIEETPKLENKKLETEIVRKFNRNKKDVIKHKILDIIKTKNITLAELREIVVEQQEYCSKASFYRYLKDMKELIAMKKNKLTSEIKI